MSIIRKVKYPKYPKALKEISDEDIVVIDCDYDGDPICSFKVSILYVFRKEFAWVVERHKGCKPSITDIRKVIKEMKKSKLREFYAGK